MLVYQLGDMLYITRNAAVYVMSGLHLMQAPPEPRGTICGLARNWPSTL